MATFRFWKPYGVLTKFTDAEGRPTLADYLPMPDVYAAGRLDMDSEGMLIVTDDGALNRRLTDPRFAHPRTYWAQVEGIPTAEALATLRAGVEMTIDGKPIRTLPVQAQRIAEPDLPPRDPPIRQRANIPTAWIALTLTEGRNRQVRRMTAAVGFPTLRLVRFAVGRITIVGLTPGEYAPIDEATIADLLASARPPRRR